MYLLHELVRAVAHGEEVLHPLTNATTTPPYYALYLLHELVGAVADGEEVRVLWVPLDRRHVLALRLVRREVRGKEVRR